VIPYVLGNIAICTNQVVGISAPGYVVYQDGMFPTAAYAGTKDTHIIINSPDTNQGASPRMEEGSCNGGQSDYKDVLLAFALDELPSAHLQNVTLGVFYPGTRADSCGGGGGCGCPVDHTVYIRQLLQDWGEGVGCCEDGPAAGEGEASWNNAKAGAAPFAWGMPGAYGTSDIFVPEAVDDVSAVYGGTASVWVPFSAPGFTPIVQTWLDDPTTNFGVKITQNPVALLPESPAPTYVPGIFGFDSSEYANDVTLRPILILAFGNKAPKAAIPTTPAPVELCGASVSFDLAATASDPENDPITVTWSSEDGTVTAGTPVTTATATFTTVGDHVVTVTVTDGTATTTASVTLTVTACRPPTVVFATTPAPVELCEASVSVDLTATAEDPQSDPLTYTWSAADGTVTPGTPASTATATFTATGDHVVTVTVTDGTQSATANVTVSVIVCAPKNNWLMGDSNADGGVDISDAVHFITWKFLGGPAPACEGSTDVNKDGTKDISDAVYLLTYMFMGGPKPIAPDGTPVDKTTCVKVAGCGKNKSCQ